LPRRPAFSDHFSATAARYARLRPNYPPRLFSYLAGIAPSRRRAWDAGAGNGQASRALARHFREVVATDASAEQIARARPHPRVTYRVAPAEKSGLSAESADLVTAAQAAHWFDLPRFWREVRRVLVPGGAVAIWCYELFRVGPRVDAVVARFYRDVVGPYWPPERKLVETGYRTVEFPFEELAPPRFEMRRRWSLPRVLGFLSTWSAVQRFRQSTGEDPVAAIRPELAKAWGPSGGARTLRWELALRVGRRPRGSPSAPRNP